MVLLRWSRFRSPSASALPVISFLFLVAFSLILPGVVAVGDVGEQSNSGVEDKDLVRSSRNKRDGSWSEWSAWSSCSRSCGGGIRTQTRQCQIRKTKSKSSEISGDSQVLSRHYRNVSSRHCEGHATRHHLCNTQECPQGTIDFRESQCQAFDNRPFMGKVYQWESFIDERSPCSLTCRAKGYRFFATLNKSVTDGTSCTSPSQMDLHVCIAGSCTPIGCDGVAGSVRRLDICGICGGDNSTCRLVSGIFTRPQLTMGYNVVAHIPKGACNINITEIRNTPNQLALRRQDGTFIFNGDFRRPSWPGVYEGAGTKFQYTRSDLKNNLEMISSAGPLKEPVDLMVMYQTMNPGIKYEYILPLSDAPIPPPPPQNGLPLQDTPQRTAMAATSRPGSYIAGPQQLMRPPLKSLDSNREGDGVVAGGGGGGSGRQHHHHHHGHHGHRRRSHHNHKAGALAAAAAATNEGQGRKFYWKMMGYTNCSEPCGGGTQRSIIRCVRAPHGNPVSDRRCTADPNSEQEKPPSQTIRCNLKPCPAEWVIGDWGECSKECGEGTKVRSIHCQQRISPTLTMRVTEGACLQRRPKTEDKCQLKSCHHWDTSGWSGCSARCGNGVRKRQVKCVDSTKEDASSLLCDPTDKPAELKPCNMGPCDMAADWFTSEWSPECSQRCGNGIQTRQVLCAGVTKGRNFTSSEYSTSRESSKERELESNLIDDDDNENLSKKKRSLEETSGEKEVYCDEDRKPQQERECFSDKACNDAVWFTGPWGECSVLCGKGLRTRQVLCIIFSRGKFKVVTDSMCPLESKPIDQETCESTKECPSRWFYTDWSECSAVCGGGTQKRYVSCRAPNWTLPSTLCSDKDRPLERRSCNEQKCSLSSSTTSKRSHTDDSGMVKDKPLQQQAAGTTLKPTVPLPPPQPSSSSSLSSLRNTNSNSSSTSRSSRSGITALDSQNHGRHLNSSTVLSPPTLVGVTTTPSASSNSRGGYHDPHEEHEDSDCADQYRNCALVVQARLCRYKYYRSVCCNSCAEAASKYQSN